MWHFKYPLAGGETYTYVEKDEDGKIVLEEERDYISIATTRPETMLGDGAVAVHPGDERYRPIVGKLCEIPVGPKEHRRLIPIITDDYPDPNFGSGAVKITGGHDLNDYGVAQRNGLPMYRLMDGTAHMRTDGPSYEDSAKRAQEIAKGAKASAEEVDALNLVPEAYRGLDRYEARKAVVAHIDAEGLMIKVEDKAIMQPFGDRSGVVIEPMLTDQWYVDAETLSKPAIEAVRSGDIAVVPETWTKTWFNWLENIQPWCVSRQLWWGHRIPAWYADDGTIFVAESEEEARKEAGDRPLRQDEDVLDTWFSSALWPFATLGWPDETEDLKRHYPNDILISGFDILFFWDARMAMQGFEFMKERPWKTLYLHGLVRDARGQKMSKSKGNTVDPLVLVEKFGADALRFTLAAMESQGRDIKLDEKRVEGYRNFATKIWNAARFLQMNGVGASDSIAAPAAELPVNRWIIGEVVETLAKLDRAFDELRYDEMADAIYHFVWGTFCDWYVELIKGDLQVPDHAEDPSWTEAERASLRQIRQERSDETKLVASWAFDQILVMLHPLMPFITEELWNGMGERPYELILARWPEPDAQRDPAAANAITSVIELIMEVRRARNELGIAPGTQLPLHIHRESDAGKIGLYEVQSRFKQMARVGLILSEGWGGHEPATLQNTPESTKVAADLRWVSVETSSFGGRFRLPDDFDIDAEKSRLSKSAEAAEKERDSLAQRLANPNFTERAKPEAVEKARADHEAKSAEAERLRAALERLG
jgi:valyl-tRNA synthetase